MSIVPSTLPRNAWEKASLVFGGGFLTKIGQAQALKPLSLAGAFNFSRTSFKFVKDLNGFQKSLLANEVPVDYNKATNKLGVLAESANSNEFFPAEDFASSEWGKSGTISSNVKLSPENTLTADKLVEPVGPATPFLENIRALSTTGIHTQRICAAYDGVRRYLLIGNNANTSFLIRYACFDLLNGVVVSNQLTDAGERADIVRDENGFWSCSISFINSLLIARAFYYVVSDTPTLVPTAYTGNGTAGMFFWGAQISRGYPTSYIRTTSGIASRAADIFEPVIDEDLIGQTTGWAMAEVELRHNVGNRRIIGLSDQTLNNRISLLTNASGNGLSVQIIKAGVEQCRLQTGSVTPGRHSLGVIYNPDRVLFSVDGNTIAEFEGAEIPACNALYMCKAESSSSNTAFFDDRLLQFAIGKGDESTSFINSTTRLS